MKKIFVTPADDLQAILDNLGGPATIYLKAGVYNCKTEIKTDGVTLVGEGCETTTLEYGDYARKIHADGKEYNTFRTYTLCVSGEGARLENLCVSNSNTDPKTVGQCVALSVNAKSFYAEGCKFRSTQDTIFLAPFPDDLVIRYRDFLPPRQLYMEGKAVHLFKNCEISGTVDFIFGGSEAYFNGCRIISLDDGRERGYIAAPSHSLAEDRGFVFAGCSLESGGAAQGSVFLARPWRDFGKCVYINCSLSRHIAPEFFDKWNDTARDKSARFRHYGLTGLENPAPVPWCRQLTEKEAEDYLARMKTLFEKV